jgi:glutamate dehydrogenase (NAD(P)+)
MRWLLADKGIFVIPDIIANSGDIISSYLEWAQGRSGRFWNRSVVVQQLEIIISQSLRDIISYAETFEIRHRAAAYMLAIQRISNITKLRADRSGSPPPKRGTNETEYQS